MLTHTFLIVCYGQGPEMKKRSNRAMEWKEWAHAKNSLLSFSISDMDFDESPLHFALKVFSPRGAERLVLKVIGLSYI